MLLTRPACLVKKNAMALIGMPLLGIIIGGGVGMVMILGMGLPVASLVLCAAIGLVFGIMIGGKQYRALSEKNEPVITRIVKKQSELAAMRQDSLEGAKKDATACVTCSGCVR